MAITTAADCDESRRDPGDVLGASFSGASGNAASYSPRASLDADVCS